MKKVTAKLAVGPMSNEVISATYKTANKHKIQLMLISSKSQVDYNGGYVNNWTTSEYAKHLKNYKGNVLVCRDHCGPGFKQTDDPADYYKTVDADIAANFDLIHVDFCHWQGLHSEKLLYSQRLIEHVQKNSPKMLFEIGTDENVGVAELDLKKIEADIDFFLGFCKPEFYVVQTGSLIKEVNQVGFFEQKTVEKAKKLLKKKGLKLKEHNADYLSADDLLARSGLVDAVNIAPMLGVLQTNFILHLCFRHGFDTTQFLNKAYESGRWQKWLYTSQPSNKYLCALTAGHYVFTSKEYQELIEKLDKVEPDLYELIVNEHCLVMENYLFGLGEI